MKPCICARAAVILALSTLLQSRGPTRATNSPIIVAATSISIRVTPAAPRFRLFAVCFISHRHIVDARYREQHTQNQTADHYAHHQNHHWLENADRKSTRLNSSHLGISYSAFCLKKKKNQRT